nr:recombinase family protein [Micromonospora sp. DSM 115978]
VDRVLSNPVYTGATVWGRTHAGRPVPPEHWVVCPHAHQPVVDGRTFFQAQLLAMPATAVLSPLLPPWEFPANSPSDAGHPDGSCGSLV